MMANPVPVGTVLAHMWSVPSALISDDRVEAVWSLLTARTGNQLAPVDGQPDGFDPENPEIFVSRRVVVG